MMIHVTAASLVSEAKSNSFPASVDSIPTSAGKEDHVSMGPIAARKLAKNVDLFETVLAIELLAAAQALDLRRPLRTSAPLEELHRLVRARVPFWDADRHAAPAIEGARAVLDGDLDGLLAPLRLIGFTRRREQTRARPGGRPSARPSPRGRAREARRAARKAEARSSGGGSRGSG